MTNAVVLAGRTDFLLQRWRRSGVVVANSSRVQKHAFRVGRLGSLMRSLALPPIQTEPQFLIGELIESRHTGFDRDVTQRLINLPGVLASKPLCEIIHLII